MRFVSPEVAIYLSKSTIQLCMGYSCSAWAGASNCYLDMLDKLQKQVCRTAGLSFAILTPWLAVEMYPV